MSEALGITRNGNEGDMRDLMNRWYYTDPLAAAWMAKHFGMKFESDFHKKFDDSFWRYDCEQAVIESCLDNCDAYNPLHKEKYCIYHDSLHLLEPQIMDSLKTIFHPITVMQKEGVYSVSVTTAKQMIDSAQAKIILRNEIVFMWPKKSTMR